MTRPAKSLGKMNGAQRPDPGPTHIKDLIPDPENRRAHNPRNIGMLVDALQKVGASRSIVVDENGVILAGNGVVEAASEAGLTKLQIVEADGETIVAVRRRGLTEEQKRALAIYDNRTSELATWNLEQLKEDAANGLDLAPYFFEDELKALFAESAGVKAGRTDPDDVPAERATDIQPGDLFELGAHRLLCGDSTKADDIARLMGDERSGVVFADPPYGMRLDTDWSSAKSSLQMIADKGLRGGNKYAPVVGDDADFDPSPMLRFWPTGEMFLWGGDYYAERLPQKNAGSWFVWDKRLDESADRMYGSCFELCWSRQRHRREMVRVKWAGVFGVEQEPDRKRHHPTQKPVALATWFLERFSNAGDIVIDPYLGSGTTLLAAEQLGRRCLAIEMAPSYCQVIIDRWEAFTGNKAVKVGEAIHA